MSHELTGLLKVLAINTILASCHNFDFLSEDSFVLPRASRSSDTSTSVLLKAEIFVIQDSQGEDAPPYPTHVTSLLFPELSSSVCLYCFDVHTQSQKRARNRNTSSDAPDGIVSFNMKVMRGINYYVILYGESLISYTSPPTDVTQLSQPSHPPTYMVKIVPWSEWGALCSRCFFDGSENETTFFIHGHRFVSMDGITPDSIQIQVRDFRPSLVRRFRQSLRVGASPTSEDSDSQATKAVKPWPFDDSWPEHESFSLQLRESDANSTTRTEDFVPYPVLSRSIFPSNLPCVVSQRVVLRKKPEQVLTGFMISDENLILLWEVRGWRILACTLY